MEPEILFLKYAFPCSFVLLSRNEITKDEHELIYKSARDEKLHLSVEKIEKIFWRAMKFIKSISDLNKVQNYWWFNHNKYIKLGKFKDIKIELIKECFVIPCRVVSIQDNKVKVKSSILDKIVELKKDFIDVKLGDKVTKHYDFICEKIPESLYSIMVERLKRIIN